MHCLIWLGDWDWCWTGALNFTNTSTIHWLPHRRPEWSSCLESGEWRVSGCCWEERREERGGEWHQQQSLHSTPVCHVSRRVMMDPTEVNYVTTRLDFRPTPVVRTCNNIYIYHSTILPLPAAVVRAGKVASYLLLVAPETIRLLQDVREPLVARNNQGRICPMREANPRKPNLPVIWYMQQTFCPGKIRKKSKQCRDKLAGRDRPTDLPGARERERARWRRGDGRKGRKILFMNDS